MNPASCPCEECAAKRARYDTARAQLIVGAGTLEGREMALGIVIAFQRRVVLEAAIVDLRNRARSHPFTGV